MSDVISLASRAAADGLEPLIVVKDVLKPLSLTLPANIGEQDTIYNLQLGPALLYEAFLYHFRSLCQLVAYDAAFSKKQFSWAGVTLYYSNFFSVLAMNRLAGGASSTVANGNRSFAISSEPIQSSYAIERIARNDHKIVWATNYELFEYFNWRDSSCDGVIIQVPTKARNYYEKHRREYLNYDPSSYTEMFKTRNRLRDMALPHGKYYSFSPASLPGLIENDWEKTIATLECHATARQMIVMAILENVYGRLGSSSKRTIKDMACTFAKNILDMSPFRSQLRNIYLDSLNALQE